MKEHDRVSITDKMIAHARRALSTLILSNVQIAPLLDWCSLAKKTAPVAG